MVFLLILLTTLYDELAEQKKVEFIIHPPLRWVGTGIFNTVRRGDDKNQKRYLDDYTGLFNS